MHRIEDPVLYAQCTIFSSPKGILIGSVLNITTDVLSTSLPLPHYPNPQLTPRSYLPPPPHRPPTQTAHPHRAPRSLQRLPPRRLLHRLLRRPVQPPRQIHPRTREPRHAPHNRDLQRCGIHGRADRLLSPRHPPVLPARRHAGQIQAAQLHDGQLHDTGLLKEFRRTAVVECIVEKEAKGSVGYEYQCVWG